MSRHTEAGLLRQINILFQRDTELFFNDRKRVGITLLLPLIIGAVIVLVSGSDVGKIYESTRATLFTIICAGIYVGMFNSLPLVCKERHIVKREYMTGMKITSYILAMVFFQAIISVIQSLIFMTVYKTAGMKIFADDGIVTFSSFSDELISLFLIMFAADMMGLLISSIVRSNELANLVAPIIIIFQLVMSGVLFDLSGWKETIANITVSKWGMQAMGAMAKLDGMKTVAVDKLGNDVKIDKLSEKVQDSLTNTGDGIYKASSGNVWEAWLWLAGMIVLLAVLSIIFLRRVEKDKR